MNLQEQKKYKDNLIKIIEKKRKQRGDKGTLKDIRYKMKMFNQLEPIYDENVQMLRQIASQQIKIIKKVINDVFLVELIKEKIRL